MSNGLYLTPDELVRTMADSRMDEEGNLVYGDEAIEIFDKALRRMKRKSTRKEPVDLSDPEVLAKKKVELAAILEQSYKDVVAGKVRIMAEYIASKKIKLGKNTVANNPELHKIYLTYRHSLASVAPATLNNDPDYYLDD